MEEPRGVVINMCDSVQFASKAVIKKKKSFTGQPWVSG